MSSPNYHYRLSSSSICSAALLLLSLSSLLLAPASAQKWNRYGPGTRTQASVIYDASTDQMIMYAGQHAPSLVDFHDTWTIKKVIASSASQFDNLNWIAVNTTGVAPKSRFGHSAVYNPTSNRMVVFGGGEGFPGPCVNDLWLLTNPNSVGTPVWSQMTATGTLPPVRQGHTAVYNATTNTMTVFGGTDCNGNYYNDVWILSNADGSTGTPSWAQASPLGTPPSARLQSTAIYDPVKNVMTVFGGGAANKVLFNDVWTLSNANGRTGTPTWAKLSPSGTPPTARSGHVAVYDSANNRMIVHGGGQINSTAIDSDTWILSDANGVGGNPAWSQVTPTDAAPARRSHTAIYDPVSNEIVIFGGTSQLPQTFTDDHVFVLTNANGSESGATWSQYGPAPRVHTSGGYDAVTDQMIVFGGQPVGNGSGLNDVWAEVGVVSDGQESQPTTNWAQVFPSGTPPSPRFGHSGLYDSGSNRMMIFGGATSATSCLNDVWILDDANSTHGTPDWLGITASGTPPAPRMNQTAVYDPTKNVLIVFGGTNCASGYFQDVWVLTNANGEGGTPTWTKLNPANTPPAARENSSSIYDSVNNVLLVYAGDAGGAGFSDLWALSNANGQAGTPRWRQFFPTGTPPAGRTGQITVYDSANNRMIMYGGINAINGTRFLYDSWILTNANSLGGTPAWNAEVVSGTAPERFFHIGFYSPTFNNLIVFGGDSQIEALPDDHIFVLSQANGLP